MLSTETRTPFTFGCRLLAAITLALTASACDPGDEQAEELALLAEQDAVDELADAAGLADAAPLAGPDGLESVETELSAETTHYTWEQGQPAVQMKANNAYFCFLTGVSGEFTSHSEGVFIYPLNGSWWLLGQSNRTGVAARAACVLKTDFGPNTYVTGEAPMGPGIKPYDFGPANDRVCVVTRMSGNFSSPDHRLETYTANGRWYVAGFGPTPGIFGMARCLVGVTTGQAPVTWSAGQPPQAVADGDLACGLGRVGGQFSTPGSRVDVSLVDDQWLLDGDSDTPGASASARCM